MLRRMLARYQMVRGKRPPGDPLPTGHRIDTRRHTRHVLRPPRDLVDEYLTDPTDAAWRTFANGYRACLGERFANTRQEFDALADLARGDDVYIGCSCPTRTNPDVRHCHTVLALEFMKKHYRDLEVVLPKE